MNNKIIFFGFLLLLVIISGCKGEGRMYSDLKACNLGDVTEENYDCIQAAILRNFESAYFWDYDGVYLLQDATIAPQSGYVYWERFFVTNESLIKAECRPDDSISSRPAVVNEEFGTWYCVDRSFVKKALIKKPYGQYLCDDDPYDERCVCDSSETISLRKLYERYDDGSWKIPVVLINQYLPQNEIDRIIEEAKEVNLTGDQICALTQKDSAQIDKFIISVSAYNAICDIPQSTLTIHQAEYCKNLLEEIGDMGFSFDKKGTEIVYNTEQMKSWKAEIEESIRFCDEHQVEICEHSTPKEAKE